MAGSAQRDEACVVRGVPTDHIREILGIEQVAGVGPNGLQHPVPVAAEATTIDWRTSADSRLSGSAPSGATAAAASRSNVAGKTARRAKYLCGSGARRSWTLVPQQVDQGVGADNIAHAQGQGGQQPARQALADLHADVRVHGPGSRDPSDPVPVVRPDGDRRSGSDPQRSEDVNLQGVEHDSDSRRRAGR